MRYVMSGRVFSNRAFNTFALSFGQSVFIVNPLITKEFIFNITTQSISNLNIENNLLLDINIIIAFNQDLNILRNYNEDFNVIIDKNITI